MTRREFDQSAWEERWSRVLHERPGTVAEHVANPHLVAEIARLPPGRALDAGCGAGADTLWLAARGWSITAVDFSTTALARARATAITSGLAGSGLVEWVEGDLSCWHAPQSHFDLVVCIYVHASKSPELLIRRLASLVAVGGTLFMVGHLPYDPATGSASAAADQRQVTTQDALAVLDADYWALIVAEERTRHHTGTGVDAVIRAVRLR